MKCVAGTCAGGGGVGTDQQGRAATGGQVPGTTLPNRNGLSATMPVALNASGDSSSVTASGISGGAITITDAEGQKAITGMDVGETIAGLKRDVITGVDGSSALEPIFDEQEILAGR